MMSYWFDHASRAAARVDADEARRRDDEWRAEARAAHAALIVEARRHADASERIAAVLERMTGTATDTAPATTNEVDIANISLTSYFAQANAIKAVTSDVEPVKPTTKATVTGGEVGHREPWCGLPVGDDRVPIGKFWLADRDGKTVAACSPSCERTGFPPSTAPQAAAIKAAVEE